MTSAVRPATPQPPARPTTPSTILFGQIDRIKNEYLKAEQGLNAKIHVAVECLLGPATNLERSKAQATLAEEKALLSKRILVVQTEVNALIDEYLDRKGDRNKLREYLRTCSEWVTKIYPPKRDRPGAAS